MKLRLRAMLTASLFTLWIASSPAGAPATKAVLLNVAAGQLPSDTGQDDKTFPEGAAVLDAVVGMRSVSPEWVPVGELPEILEEPLLPQPA